LRPEKADAVTRFDSLAPTARFRVLCGGGPDLGAALGGLPGCSGGVWAVSWEDCTASNRQAHFGETWGLRRPLPVFRPSAALSGWGAPQVAGDRYGNREGGRLPDQMLGRGRSGKGWRPPRHWHIGRASNFLGRGFNNRGSFLGGAIRLFGVRAGVRRRRKPSRNLFGRVGFSCRFAAVSRAESRHRGLHGDGQLADHSTGAPKPWGRGCFYKKETNRVRTVP